MEENADFFQSLETALQKYRASLEQTELRQLKEEFRFFHNSFQSLYEVLLRKGLLNQDPYKHEHKISEVSPPPAGPMKESEKKDTLSQRLSLYDSVLEFLNNYYQFDLDYINLGKIKELASMVNYIRWASFSETSSNLNTRVLAEITKKLPANQDDLSSSILRDSIKQLEKRGKLILGILKKISIYQKERYKYEFRLQLFHSLKIKPESIENRREDVIKAIKARFPKLLPDTPYYPELIEEVLDESAGIEADHMQHELFKRLEVKEKKEEQKALTSFKPILLESCRILSSGTTPLEQCISKLSYNAGILDNRQYTFMEKLTLWFFELLRKEEEKRVFEIEYFDPQTAASKTVRINFDKFIEDLQKKSKLLGAMGNRMSSTYQKLEQSSEEQIFKLLTVTIDELQGLLLRLPALDTYMKSEVPRAQRSMIKGIKIEIGALKNAVVKANQKKYEYIAQKEEQEQLKKLGIKI
jgi:hypothetical protein